MNVLLTRYETSDQGTFGLLVAESGFSCGVLELPWRDNRASVSCVPLGEYRAVIRQSPKFGKVFHLTNVQGRSFILMHQGNLAGDTSKGWKTHSHGCLLLGKYRGKLTGQAAMLASLPTLRAFMRETADQPFNLKIVRAKNA
jgi:hypothetical protein